MCVGMSELVCSLIWTYLHSSNKRLWACKCACKQKPPAAGRVQTISAHHWAGLCQPPNYILAPTCSTFTSALPAFSEPSPWRLQVTHPELILNRLGGIVHSHAGAQTSVWRWFCYYRHTHTHLRRRAKSSPLADFREMTIWHCSTARWHCVTIDHGRQWEV